MTLQRAMHDALSGALTREQAARRLGITPQAVSKRAAAGGLVALRRGRVSLSAGSRAPLHATATGKAILAALPGSQRDTVIAQMKLAKRASNTITSKKALRDALAEHSSEGLLVDDEESAPGIQAIAAPIIALDGEVLGAIELRAPRSASTIDRLRSAHGAAVLDTARRLSVGLDFVHAAAG
jgi:DNA-binding IclR family transcriptional regulator